MHQRQRRFVTLFAAAAREIPVQLVLQELADVGRPVLLLHDHERRILRQSLGHHVGSLGFTADELMSPPLVCQLVGRDVKDLVDVLGLFHPLDKTEPFRVRHGVGE